MGRPRNWIAYWIDRPAIDEEADARIGSLMGSLFISLSLCVCVCVWINIVELNHNFEFSRWTGEPQSGQVRLLVRRARLGLLQSHQPHQGTCTEFCPLTEFSASLLPFDRPSKSPIHRRLWKLVDPTEFCPVTGFLSRSLVMTLDSE